MDRTKQELQSLFGDPKYARKAWQSVGKAILLNPAKRSATVYDKEGNETMQTQLEAYTYEKLHRDLTKLNQEDREPTELEMIMYGQIVKARYDTAAATFVRDTLGAKPIDESKVDASVTNQFETLTDDEVDALLKYRESKNAENAQTDNNI